MQLIDGGRFLATLSEDRKLRTWNLITNERLCNVEYGDTDPNGLVQLKPGVLGTTREYHNELKLWDTNACKKIKDIKLGSEVEDESWLKPINERLVAVGFESKVKVYDLEDKGRVVAELSVKGDLTDLDVSGKYLYAANDEGFVFVWDVNNDFEQVKKFKALKENGNLDAFRLRVVSESRLVTWYKKQMCVWKDFESEGCFTSKNEFKNAQALKDYTNVNATQGNGSVYLMTSSAGGYVTVWDLIEKRNLSEKKLPTTGSVSFIQLDKNVLFPEGIILNYLIYFLNCTVVDI
jgi:WD40 repeat protein